MTLPAPRYFMIRVRRDGPLTPAKLWLCDHAPGEPDNKLDRGNLSIYPRAEIAGKEVDPELLFDRVFSHTDWQPAYAVSHWKFASTITETEYRYRVAHLTWAQQHRPGDPTGHARKPLDAAQMPLPNFERENRP